MIELVLIASGIAILAAGYVMLRNCGFLSDVKPIVTETPKFLDKNLTVYYKYNVGPYFNTGKITKEVKSLLPAGATTFGIFYDNPETTAANLLQSAVGVVFGDEKAAYYQDNYAQQLVRHGYEKMTLVKSTRVVQATQPNSGGMLSVLALVNRTYGIVKDYISRHRLDVKFVLEFYAPDEIVVLFPLDNSDDYKVNNYVPTSELEEALTRQQNTFSSDEGLTESGSESGGDNDDEEENDVAKTRDD